MTSVTFSGCKLGLSAQSTCLHIFRQSIWEHELLPLVHVAVQQWPSTCTQQAAKNLCVAITLAIMDIV